MEGGDPQPAAAAVDAPPAAAAGDGAADTSNDAAIAAALAAADDEAAAREAAAVAAAADAAEAQQPLPQQQQSVLLDSLHAIKLGGLRLASMIKDSTKPRPEAGGPRASDMDAGAPAPEQPQQPGGGEGGIGSTMGKLATAAAGLGARTSRMAALTTESLRRITAGEPMQALVKSEAQAKPVPQLVLACCTYLAATGLKEPCLFQHEPPAELVAALASAMGPRAKLIQPGASPHAVAALLKQFLCGLPEPLLTYRLLPQWMAMADTPEDSLTLLAQLPAANANSLRLLLQLCHHIDDRSAATEMDAQALAEALAPCLAWKPVVRPAAGGPPAAGSAASASGGPLQAFSRVLSMGKPKEGEALGGDQPEPAGPDAVQIVQLDAPEKEAVAAVLTYLIANFANLFG